MGGSGNPRGVPTPVGTLHAPAKGDPLYRSKSAHCAIINGVSPRRVRGLTHDYGGDGIQRLPKFMLGALRQRGQDVPTGRLLWTLYPINSGNGESSTTADALNEALVKDPKNE